MAEKQKNQSEILQKLGIEQLNDMQLAAQTALYKGKDLVLLSPTGSGKTLAFMLPIINGLNEAVETVQALIVVPSRELAIQIEQVIREMGTGFKTNAFYGGRNFSKDRQELNHPPSILVGTPGRIADHLRRDTFDTATIKTLVLDEFDKSLEIGFELDMKNIIDLLRNKNQKILTSATQGIDVPDFVRLNNPESLDFLHLSDSKLELKILPSPSKDKLETLGMALKNLSEETGIIFCNFKDSIERVSIYLEKIGIPHGCFYGGMEQKDRERVLIKFRNGTFKIIIATDLAARGLDIPELNFIIHYQLPPRLEEFTHRNGRTARMKKEGIAYILKSQTETLPDFIPKAKEENFKNTNTITLPEWLTVFVSGGRGDKISKGDIAGFFMKQGGLGPDDVGPIELKSDCAFVAINAQKAEEVVKKLSDTKLKTKKVRLSII